MIAELCKGVHCVDLDESFQTHIYLQNLASIQPRTSPTKFGRSPRGRELGEEAGQEGLHPREVPLADGSREEQYSLPAGDASQKLIGALPVVGATSQNYNEVRYMSAKYMDFRQLSGLKISCNS